MTGEPRWLSEDEQCAWRAYLRGAARLDAALDRDLQEHGLSLSEYDVLAVLSEDTGCGCLRMSEVAQRVLQSRSRLTHTANRLEKRGLVQRVDCQDDRRGVNLALTPLGHRTIREAAPWHVESVRRNLVDLMTPEEFVLLGDLMRRIDEAATRPVR